MQAQTSPAQAHSLIAWVLAAFGVALLVLLLLSFIADTRPVATTEVLSDSSRVAYLEFGATADVLWLANPDAPVDRRRLHTIPHAVDYGIVPRISPDGDYFAYTALPAGLANPRPDSPAELWIVVLHGVSPPMRLAEGVDLLVTPVWSPDGASLVYRRSTRTSHVLAMTNAGGGEERVIAYSEREALFPIGFTPGGHSLYFAGISESGGSRLYEVLLRGGETEIATLSPALTRDWTLSPDGNHLAYLEIAFSETQVASRLLVLDVATGGVSAVTAIDEVAFGPVWAGPETLAAGTFNPDSLDAGLLLIDGVSRTKIAGSPAGFDVPLAYNALAGGYLVRAFQNDSITSPGPSQLVLVKADGEREIIAEGEVTLVGWTHP